MKTIIFLILMCLGSLTIAKDNDPRHIMVAISKTPPQGYSYNKWYNECMYAVHDWFIKTGCNISFTEDKSEADIYFYTNDIRHTKAYARCHRGWTSFPNLPHITQISIEVNYYFNSCPYPNLERTLKHEVGHAIGLNHTEGSIVSDDWPRPSDLTPKDYESIRQLKAHIDRLYPETKYSPKSSIPEFSPFDFINI